MRYSTASRAWTWAAIALGVVVASLATAAALQFSSIASPSPVDILPLAQTFDALASQALARDRTRARALTMAELSLQPANGRAWLRLAIIDAQTPAQRASALIWLRRSFETAPYDPQILGDRIRFAGDHWDELDADLQRQSISQMRTSWPIGDQRQQLLSAVSQISNPTGRLVIASQLFGLKLTENINRRHYFKDQQTSF